MGRRARNTTTAAVAAVAVLLIMTMLAGQASSQEAQAEIPQDAKHVGLTKCAACHFPQYTHWKTSPHGKAFEILPTKYKQDPSCLKCHTTGYGLPTTVEDPAAVHVTGVNCEACHGPGSEHARIALGFVDTPMNEEGLEKLRNAITKIDPTNVCIKCHVSMAHKTHPEFDREPGPAGALPGPTTRRSQGFFKIHE